MVVSFSAFFSFTAISMGKFRYKGLRAVSRYLITGLCAALMELLCTVRKQMSLVIAAVDVINRAVNVIFAVTGQLTDSAAVGLAKINRGSMKCA